MHITARPSFSVHSRIFVQYTCFSDTKCYANDLNILFIESQLAILEFHIEYVGKKWIVLIIVLRRG